MLSGAWSSQSETKVCLLVARYELTSGRDSSPLDCLELVRDEGVHPEVPGEKEHGDESVDAAIVQPEGVDIDEARAVLLFVAERQHSLFVDERQETEDILVGA